ncbi:MAG: hypothetical protein JJU30_13270 [Alkalimonas sp.]|nr:hypothetical protein [Alkalimonas sp.]
MSVKTVHNRQGFIDQQPHISCYAIPVAGVDFAGTTYLFEAIDDGLPVSCPMPSERCDSQFLLESYYQLLRQQNHGSSGNVVVLCHETQLNQGDLLALARSFPNYQFYFAVPLQGRSFNEMQQAFRLPPEPNTHYGFYDEYSMSYIQWLLQSQRLETLFVGYDVGNATKMDALDYSYSGLHFNKLDLSLVPASPHQKTQSFFLISCRQHLRSHNYLAKESP